MNWDSKVKMFHFILHQVLIYTYALQRDTESAIVKWIWLRYISSYFIPRCSAEPPKHAPCHTNSIMTSGCRAMAPVLFKSYSRDSMCNKTWQPLIIKSMIWTKWYFELTIYISLKANNCKIPTFFEATQTKHPNRWLYHVKVISHLALGSLV